MHRRSRARCQGDRRYIKHLETAICLTQAPSGAGYTGRPELFLKGRPLNVTGLDFGPDGAMYLVTGGRRTQSGLYRVKWAGPAFNAKNNEVAIEEMDIAVEGLELE